VCHPRRTFRDSGSRALPQHSVYWSSKRALLGFSLTARAELEKDRIIVSGIYPFITATSFGKNRMGNSAGGGSSSNYADASRCTNTAFIAAY
jgi:short-subunit dehydrogenase